jgi:hypothetical protein
MDYDGGIREFELKRSEHLGFSLREVVGGKLLSNELLQFVNRWFHAHVEFH